MKFLLILLFPFCLIAQDDINIVAAINIYESDWVSEYRLCKDSMTYLVKYEFDRNGTYTEPLTYPAGKPHYPATITVYRLGDEIKMVGKPFGGQFVYGGCFEDVPEAMVFQARSNAHEFKD